MKTWLKAGLVSLALAVGVTSASYTATRNWNLVQKPNGTTVWRDPASNEVRVDRRMLYIYLADIGSAATGHVATPNAGYVSAIYATSHVAANATTVLSCGVGSGAAGGGTPFTSGTVTFSVAASGAGQVASGTPTAANSVAAGEAIYCGSDGGASNTVPSMITIVLDGNF